jgi:rhodanese-related sulfurtransferase
MATIIERERVKLLVDAGAQLLEVLPRKEYDEEHLVGALHYPLAELRDRASELDRAIPVIVYCWDYPCDLSPRAAATLDALGFGEVYDYAASKLDWIASALPTEGAAVPANRVTNSLDRGIPTADPDERAAVALERMRSTGRGFVIIVDHLRVVLGDLPRELAEKDPDARCDDLMRSDPRTWRADAELDVARKEMRDDPYAIVTDPSGRLIGVIDRG